MQLVAAVAPAGDDACAGQRVQLPSPVAGLNWPAGHGTQSPSPSRVKPGRHVQLVTRCAPGGDVELSGHARQAWLPEAFLNVPAAHASHAPPSPDGVKPATHEQLAA